VLAGADPYEGDRLGRLALTKDGLRERDTLVRDAMDAAGVPVCVTLAGGYAEDVRDTVEINVNTLRVFTRLDVAVATDERIPA
jgi:acetoin utilization deacetylase AcuC-like enzyme